MLPVEPAGGCIDETSRAASVAAGPTVGAGELGGGAARDLGVENAPVLVMAGLVGVALDALGGDQLGGATRHGQHGAAAGGDGERRPAHEGERAAAVPLGRAPADVVAALAVALPDRWSAGDVGGGPAQPSQVAEPASSKGSSAAATNRQS